jgi:pSer/pThr/pTyr-binding forkhead associated (FHA) protein
MEMKLRVDAGKNAGKEIRVPGRKFVIGRGEDCQLRAASDMISRRHCELTVEDSYAAVKDLGSRNGTLVNGEVISGETQLKSGDKLKVGPLEFEILLATGLTGKKHPPVHGVKEAAARSAKPESQIHTEEDIAQWLMGDSQPASANKTTAAGAAMRDTQHLRTGDTEVIKLGETTDAPAIQQTQISAASGKAAPPDPAEAKRGMFGGGPKKVFGKLPGGEQAKQPTGPPKDSREAAADAIKKFREKR